MGKHIKHGDNVSDLTNDSGYLTTQLLNGSGRWYCYADNRWITDSDDNYGVNYYQLSESAGAGATPIVEWEHLGILIPAGTTIKKLHVMGRTTSTEVTDMEIYITFRVPSPITRWESGLDNDGEDVDTLLYNNFFFSPTDGGAAFTGDMADIHRRTMNIDTTVADDGILSIHMRPVGTITTTRFFMSSYTWELS